MIVYHKNYNPTAIIKYDESDEVNSTKMALYNIGGINLMIRKCDIDITNMNIGISHVSNLYGSVNVNKATQLIRERALETKCKWGKG